MKIENQVAIIAGGGSGLGAATAKFLSAAGAKVAVLDLDSDAARQSAKDTGAVFYAADVTSEAQVSSALDAVQDALGVARILVNCAGIAPAARVVGRKGTHTLDLIEKVIRINLIGTFNVARLFAERLVPADAPDEDKGVIINTASVAAFDGQIGQAAYAASKGGVAGMTIALARDLAQHRIRAMTIAPGTFLTPMLTGMPPEVQDGLKADIPHPHRLGDPSEYAQLVKHIIENPYLNGETIRIDGALRMK